MVIAIDFDGTCVAGGFPDGFYDIGAQPILKRIIANGHKLALWTRRSHMRNVDSFNPEGADTLQIALDWFNLNDIPLSYVNERSEDKLWSTSPKMMYDLLIDDRALGIPLVKGEELYVDWEAVEELLIDLGVIQICL